jgi:hypothetical protein
MKHSAVSRKKSMPVGEHVEFHKVIEPLTDPTGPSELVKRSRKPLPLEELSSSDGIS